MTKYVLGVLTGTIIGAATICGYVVLLTLIDGETAT